MPDPTLTVPVRLPDGSRARCLVEDGLLTVVQDEHPNGLSVVTVPVDVAREAIGALDPIRLIAALDAAG